MTIQFWLGTHQPSWLERTDAPLMVCHHRLTGRRSLPRARGPWVLDSGAFTTLGNHGHHPTSPREYARAVRRYADEIGQLAWAAPQDWMCEPFMVARTGLSVAEHQRRTIGNYLDLRGLDAPVIPVLQGWQIGDYLDCAERYAAAGINLKREPVVGLGSVCRRQHTDTILELITVLQPLRLHGFGMKTEGVARGSFGLASADSLAWSRGARTRRILMAGCQHPRGAKTCSNCLRYALWWRQRVLAGCTGHQQLTLGAVA